MLANTFITTNRRNIVTAVKYNLSNKGYMIPFSLNKPQYEYFTKKNLKHNFDELIKCSIVLE